MTFLITYSFLEVTLCHHYSQMIIYTWKYVHTDVDICLRHLFCFNWLRIKQVKVDLILFDIETRWRSRQSFCVVTSHIGDKSIFCQDTLWFLTGESYSILYPHVPAEACPSVTYLQAKTCVFFPNQRKSYSFYLHLGHVFTLSLSIGNILCISFIKKLKWMQFAKTKPLLQWHMIFKIKCFAII